jgi:hypothetical protein
MRAMNSLWGLKSSIGLFGNHVDVVSGKWTATEAGIGAGIDSYYEYMVISQQKSKGYNFCFPGKAPKRDCYYGRLDESTNFVKCEQAKQEIEQNSLVFGEPESKCKYMSFILLTLARKWKLCECSLKIIVDPCVA